MLGYNTGVFSVIFQQNDFVFLIVNDMEAMNIISFFSIFFFIYLKWLSM